MKRSLAGRALTALRRVACCALLLSALPAVAAADDGSSVRSLFVERPEADLLLLALKLDQTTLADSVPAYEHRGGVLVPLGEVCRLLGLGITVDVARGQAAGFFIDERRTFALDVAFRRVIVEGQPRRFDPAGIEVHEDDIYVDAALLSEWLPLRLGVDLFGAVVTARPLEKLPLQQRLERDSKLASSASRRPVAAAYPRQAQPYRLFDGPFVDQTLRYTRQPGSGWSGSRPGAPRGAGQGVVEYSTYATGDALFMEASAFVTGTQAGFADSRFSLARKDPEAHLLGVLGAREVVIGDVFHQGLDLIASPISGPGLLVSNFPLELQAQFDRQSFRGDLPPGWEAELYRGAELLAYAQSRPDGLYEFLDVPLLFGLNVFRVELYGPQGQHRSEIHRFNVGDTLTPKGKVFYRLAGNEPSHRLLGTGRVDAGARSSFELSAGLTKNLSASVSLAAVDLADRRHTYGKAALRGYWGFVFANLDLAADRDGGSAWQATLQSRLGAFGLQVQHAQLRDFVSERFVSSLSPLRSRTTLRLDTAIPAGWLPRLPVLVEVRHERLASGQRVSQLTGRVSAFRRGLAVANQVSWNVSSGGGAASARTAAGLLLVSKYMQSFSLRGEVGYTIAPVLEVTNVALTGQKRVAHGILVSGGVSRALANGQLAGGQTRLLAGVSRLEGTFGFGLTADYTGLAGFGASAMLSVSVGRDGRDGSWHPQARALAGSGAVSARAFLDTNGNGLMDVGEAAIPGAGFLLDGASQKERTDDQGQAFMPNVSPHRDVEVALAPSTLEDPYWKPASAGVRLLPRPGKVAVIDFPVLITGEISGTVYLRRDGVNRAASGIELELVDRRGIVVQRVRTAYDGFYDITEITPGGYTLSVAAEHIVRLRVVARSREVAIAADGTVLDGADFVLPLAAEITTAGASPPSSRPPTAGR